MNGLNWPLFRTTLLRQRPLSIALMSLCSVRIAREPYCDPLTEEEELLTYTNYLTNLVTKLHSIQTLAREHLINSELKSKKYYDRKVKILEFQVGDFVFLLSGPKPHKLKPQYSGPFKVLKIFENGNVKIEMGKRSKVVHPNRLKFSKINDRSEQRKSKDQ